MATRSKTSKTPPKPTARSLWKAEPRCSEARLELLARALAPELRAGDCVLLDGPLGAGKSTFARFLLKALQISQPAEGSPTFAIAHEYSSPRIAEVVHVDLYRIRSAQELEEAGILAYLWERPALVLFEWASLWPEVTDALTESSRKRAVWRVDLMIHPDSPDLRDARIWKESNQRSLAER